MKTFLTILMALAVTGCAWNRSVKVGEAEGYGVKVKDVEVSDNTEIKKKVDEKE